MPLSGLTDKREIRSAFDAYTKNLYKGLKPTTRMVGFPGGQHECKVHWMPDHSFWAVTTRPLPDWGRYWCLYGLQPPETKTALNITVEINPPEKDKNLRCAGLFVRDEQGRVFLAHSGKIGGGYKGVGKSAFLQFAGELNRQVVSWSDGSFSNAILIARIDAPALRRQLGAFVKKVDEFKQQVRSPQPQDPVQKSESSYYDEFMGSTQSYIGGSPTEGFCEHGFVIRDLKKALDTLHVAGIGKDGARDLFITRNSRVELLFEAKTDTDPQSIYTGIGQLMLHGAAQASPPRRVLVLPNQPSEETLRRLASLNIDVVTFKFNETLTRFAGLTRVLAKVDL